MKNLITLFITAATLVLYSGLANSMDVEGLDVTISVMESDPHEGTHEIDLPGHDDVAHRDDDHESDHDAHHDDNDDDGLEHEEEADDHDDANEEHDTAAEDHGDSDGDHHVEDETSSDHTPAV